ncbi:MAG: hypothetical protein FWE34_06695 [Defluviitaleaceae bacterium]|nr:hypothetical protein [Defluviitaleaceae bacterium]
MTKLLSNSKATKIIVDILMTVFLVLSFIRWESDLTFHGIVGTACAIFFAMHIIIHRKWIKAMTKSCLTGKLKKSLAGKYIVDMLLLVMWSVSIATGFLAIGSFTFGIEWMHIFSRIHGVTARIGLGLVVIHFIQHLPQIKSYFTIKRKTA